MRSALSLLILCLAAAPAAAQNYLVDQVSPYDNASYNGALGGSWVWEQQVRTGVTGLLAGFELQVNSYLPNDAMTVEIVDGALGAGGPVLWHGSIRTTRVNVWQNIKVSVLSANIMRTAQDLFIIRIIADSAGMGFNGNAYFPQLGYPEDFWENGGSVGGSARLGFKTYVFNGPILTLGGTCPGSMTLNVSEVSPNGSIALLHGVPGSTTRNGAPCAGLTIGLDQVRFIGFLNADALGNASLNFNAPAQLCGRTILGVDVGACRFSNSLVL
jgi:hypothetical protein